MDTDPVPPGTWRCLVCQRPSPQIHVLPCQHKFCLPCLELWAGIYVNMYHGGRDEQFPCQVCWKLYDVPQDTGMAAYRQDYQVHLLEDGFEKMSCGSQQNIPPAGQASVFGGQPNYFSSVPNPGSTAAFPSSAPDSASMVTGAAYPDATQGNSGITNPGPYIGGADINCDDEDNMVPITHSPGGTAYPSMVSHMVAPPQPITAHSRPDNEDTTRTAGNNYCRRSHHLYMHMA